MCYEDAMKSCTVCWLQPWSPYGPFVCCCCWEDTYPAWLQEHPQRHRDAHVAKKTAEYFTEQLQQDLVGAPAPEGSNTSRALAHLAEYHGIGTQHISSKSLTNEQRVNATDDPAATAAVLTHHLKADYVMLPLEPPSWFAASQRQYVHDRFGRFGTCDTHANMSEFSLIFTPESRQDVSGGPASKCPFGIPEARTATH